ncbi:MAG TPA: TIGR03790 family protein [Candidatus Baltobacteraceae bacterium]|jgi:uncharacterized protein (TIGR03790 family)|nr:TIGR03790 family protein [Candidatus Baltobacteraceae bacterium]
MLNRPGILWLALMMTVVSCAWAGDSGLNVIVVVNQNSSNSVHLGNDYCERRGVPPQNLFRMTSWTGGSISWQLADFENDLLDPLLGMISSRGLTNQAQIVLLSMDVPYRVISSDGSENGTTSALFYGFKTNTAPPPGLPDTCSLPGDSTNSYSFSELPFALAQPDTASTNAFLAVMLTGTNLAEAESTLEVGAISDGSFPPETVYLEKTTDSARNVRFFVFDNAIQECRARGDDDVTRTNSNSTAFTNALGLDTGLISFSVPTNAFVPGAVADSLTSFAGDIFENSGPTQLLEFLEAGACASYGTVVEPCNYTYKFPDPMVYFYQNRGFCLAEAYYQSLANPYEGLMVGEPLSAPFARLGAGTWNSPSNGSVLSGSAAFNLTFSAADTNHPLAQVDLFVDGGFVETLTNLPPAVGNNLSVTIDGVTASYTVAFGDTLGSAATGLASALTAQQNTNGVQTDVVGDRLVMRSQNVATLGSQISVQAGAVVGSAPTLTSFAAPALPTFLDSTAYGYHFVEATNDVGVGDWLQMTFIKTNGNRVTVAVTNTQSGASIMSLLGALMNQINENPALQTADGANASDLLDQGNGFYSLLVYAASPGWPAAQIQTVFTGATNLDATPTGTNALEDNLPDLQPRAHVYLSSGAASLPVQFTLDTTAFADGFHELTAVAYEGTSVRTQTPLQETVQFRNTSLSATFAAVGADTNGNLLFGIAANDTNIARIELFSTGGSVAVATNQPAAELAAPAAILGVGLHPFYGVVTDTNGHQYQTPTVWEQLPALQLTVVGPPDVLSWPAIAGRQYNVLAATNLGGAFQTIATVLATNGQAQWSITGPSAGATFYSVSVTP